MPRTARRPATERGNHRHRLKSPLRRFIDLDRRRRGKPQPANQPTRFEFSEALGQYIRADSREVRFQSGEAPRAVSKFAKHQHGPALAEQFHCVGEPAGIVVTPFFLALPMLSYFL